MVGASPILGKKKNTCAETNYMGTETAGLVGNRMGKDEAGE